MIKGLYVNFDATPFTPETEKAFDKMSDEERISFIQQVIEARNKTYRNDDQGREAVAFLTQHFGEKVMDNPGFKKGGRLMYTLDSQEVVFRCWYEPFGGVSRFPGHSQHYHFDSCGVGLLFHVEFGQAGNKLTVRRKLIGTLTQGMLQWHSVCGTMWAGWV